MTTAVNLAATPTDIGGGRLLGPHGSGHETAEDVKVTDEVRALHDSGRIALDPPPTDEPDPLSPEGIGSQTIEQVLTLVGDDEDKRRLALASETSRGDDARRTLIEKLTEDE